MVFLVGGGCCLNCAVMCFAGLIMLEILKNKSKYGMKFKVQYKMSLAVRKPVFGVSDQVQHKPGCTVTEDG